MRLETTFVNRPMNEEAMKAMLSASLDEKVWTSLSKIDEWEQATKGNWILSFSGGKDSTVLAYLCAKYLKSYKIQPHPLHLVFADTGLEYPEIRRFAMAYPDYLRKHFPGLEVDFQRVRPKERFDRVISKYGYPLIGKEVAEAIYAARKIRSQNVNVEREREREPDKWSARKRAELHGERPSSADWNGKSCDHGKFYKGNEGGLIETSGARNRQTILQGKWIATNAGGGVFSNSAEQFGEKSMFNKDRWLPLCRDLPALISHLCCSKTKKEPIHRIQSRLKLYPMTATMAEESRVRKQAWARTGCNAFEGDKPMSKPMSFWTNQDVLNYIVQEGIPICSVYGDIVVLDRDGMEYPAQMCAGCGKLRTTGAKRTGCTFCAFGLHLERGETRFECLARTHPRHYEFAISGGMWADNPHYDPTAPKMDGDWQNWNPKKIWVPGNGGLGLGKVFEMANEIYGKKVFRW